MRIRFVPSAIAILCLPGLAQAQLKVSRGLAIGDQAPAIDISHWLKGDEIERFQEGEVYVLDFWATWCGPCVAGMPRLSAMQDAYGPEGATIIGISIEPPDDIRRFLSQRSPYDGKINRDRISYTLTTDPDRSVYRDYMTAANETGIPTAFVVGKQGHVEWIGHPTFLEPVLKRVIDDDWDRQAARRIRYDLEPKLIRAFNSRKWTQALQIIDEITALDPARAAEFESQKFTLLLTRTDRAEEAYDLGETLIERMWDDPKFLNQIAWFVVDNPEVRERDLEFAMRAAERANELTQKADAMILDTVARVHFEMGELEKAIEVQVRAVEHLKHTIPASLHDQIRQTLSKYRKQLDRRMPPDRDD